MQNIGTLLQGVSAGLSGNLPQFNAMQDQRKMIERQDQQQLSKERYAAIVQDSYQLQKLIGAGKMTAAVKLLDNRIDSINKLGGDPSDTLQAKELLVSGDPAKFQQLQQILSDTVDAGAMFWQPPEAERMTPYQQAQIDLKKEQLEFKKQNPNAGAAGQIPASIQEIAYYNSLPEGAEKEAVGRKIGMVSKEGQEISAYSEKALGTAIDLSAKSQADSVRYKSIADDLRANAATMKDGKMSQINEAIKTFTGGEDGITALRKSAMQVVNSEAIKSLPPGSATEKDVELALAPLPTANADPVYVANWLDAISRINEKAAEYQNFKAEFISQNNGLKTRSGESLISAWRKQQEEGQSQAPAGATPGIAPSSVTSKYQIEVMP